MRRSQPLGRAQRGQGTRGFSLLEVVISLPILALMTLALVTAVIYASRTSRVVTNKIAAKNLAQSYLERMFIDRFQNVTEANYPSVTLSSNPGLYLDGVRKTRCEVIIRITGYGKAESGSATTLVDNDALWEPKEWVGNTLLLTNGTGRGQRAVITANTNQTLTVGQTLNPAPSSDTEYMINGGKTVRVTVRWNYMGKAYSTTVQSLIVDWGSRQ